jgi:hypothetical protein
MGIAADEADRTPGIGVAVGVALRGQGDGVAVTRERHDAVEPRPIGSAAGRDERDDVADSQRADRNPARHDEVARLHARTHRTGQDRVHMEQAGLRGHAERHARERGGDRHRRDRHP